MSIWSSIEGTIRVHSIEKFSLAKYTKSIINSEYVLNVEDISPRGGSYLIQFTLNVVVDGADASAIFDRYMSGIPGSYELETHIRYSG